MTPSTPRHVGIVACSAEGASLCYRTLCSEGATLLGAYGHPEVSLHTHPHSAYVRCLERNDWSGVAELMLSSANTLVKAGAELLICPDNTIHTALPFMAEKPRAPWIHIADVVVEQAVERRNRRVGLIGTRWVMSADLYPERLARENITCVRPTAGDRAEVDRIIMHELVYGNFETRSIVRLLEIIERLESQGCEAVILGCTELPLVIDHANSPLPTLDSTRLLARAALRAAMRPPAS